MQGRDEQGVAARGWNEVGSLPNPEGPSLARRPRRGACGRSRQGPGRGWRVEEEVLAGPSCERAWDVAGVVGAPRRAACCPATRSTAESGGARGRGTAAGGGGRGGTAPRSVRGCAPRRRVAVPGALAAPQWRAAGSGRGRRAPGRRGASRRAGAGEEATPEGGRGGERRRRAGGVQRLQGWGGGARPRRPGRRRVTEAVNDPLLVGTGRNQPTPGAIRGGMEVFLGLFFFWNRDARRARRPRRRRRRGQCGSLSGPAKDEGRGKTADVAGPGPETPPALRRPWPQHR